jgi:uncharacterized protein YjbI with pentapeptide repeats
MAAGTGTLYVRYSRLHTRSNEKAKISERFGKALDHLGAIRRSGDQPASEVRVGAVAELQGIGEESTREQRMIRSAFATYLRHFANWGAAMDSHSGPAVWNRKETQAMMRVLARWGIPTEDRDELGLSDLDLRHVSLSAGANFADVIADRTKFDHGRLSGVVFRRARLYQSSFRGAKLQNADFHDADLSSCKFAGVEALEHRWGWDKEQHRFDWNNAMPDAILTGADLTGAKLTGAKIKKTQFDSAKIDAKTIPPESFEPE